MTALTRATSATTFGSQATGRSFACHHFFWISSSSLGHNPPTHLPMHVTLSLELLFEVPPQPTQRNLPHSAVVLLSAKPTRGHSAAASTRQSELTQSQMGRTIQTWSRVEMTSLSPAWIPANVLRVTLSGSRMMSCCDVLVSHQTGKITPRPQNSPQEATLLPRCSP